MVQSIQKTCYLVLKTEALPVVARVDDTHQRPCSVVLAQPEAGVEVSPTIYFSHGDHHVGNEHDLLHPAHLLSPTVFNNT